MTETDIAFSPVVKCAVCGFYYDVDRKYNYKDVCYRHILDSTKKRRFKLF